MKYNKKARIVKVIEVDGEFVRIMSKEELDEIMNDKGVKFFPKRYSAPKDIYDLYDDGTLTNADITKFNQCIRDKYIMAETNLVVVNKDQTAKAANKLEMGKIMNMISTKADETNTNKIKKVGSQLKKFVDLGLMAETYNDKLQRVEYYINPLYKKPGSRLNVELYGLFRKQLFDAMTVKSKKASDYRKKNTIPSDLVSSNTYRDAIQQEYESQTTTTVGTDKQVKIETLRVLEERKENYKSALDFDCIEDSTQSKKEDKEKVNMINSLENMLDDKEDLELDITTDEITEDIFNMLKRVIAVNFNKKNRADLIEAAQGYIKLTD